MAKFLVAGFALFLDWRSGFRFRFAEWDGESLTLKKWRNRTSCGPGFYEPFEIAEFGGPTRSAWNFIEALLEGQEPFKVKIRG